MSIACRTRTDPAYSCTPKKKSSFFLHIFFFFFFITSNPSESVVVHPTSVSVSAPGTMLANFTSLLTNFGVE
ncbi:metallothionein-like protein 3B [Iris pallida]|uniref:Metallothionein-like protein 3B n=1 Tax=Iris pallida TaxID=29817 RepID=A0AAX6EMJ2_IRIPA|nr:metallothionein-like protein 3B [Iris pallida]